MPPRALVVGGTSGIGRGVAVALAARGVDVTVAGRSEANGGAVVAECRQRRNGDHAFYQVDCFSLDSVKGMAEAHAATGVDLLVLSQGMATTQGYTPTRDGFDQKLQLHFYSRLLLAQLLAPILERSAMEGGGKVLSVLSAGVHAPYLGYESDPEVKEDYSLKNAADAAGFYNDLAMDKLSQLHPKVNFTHCAPGFVNTNWGAELPALMRGFTRMMQACLATPLDKAGTVLSEGWLALGPGFHLIDKNGKLTPKVCSPAHTTAMNSSFWSKLQDRLRPWL